MSLSKASNNASERGKHSCIACLLSFTITDAGIPLTCIDKKCDRLICAQCVQEIATYNGPNRQYCCMYCLKNYPKSKLPEKNQAVFEKLLNEMNINYGHERTHRLTNNDCNAEELIFDITLRIKQVKNLVHRAKQYPNNSKVRRLMLAARTMLLALSALIQDLEQHQSSYIAIVQNDYKDTISNSEKPNDLVAKYIKTCEELRSALVVAEHQMLFPKTYALKEQWSQQQGSGNDFIPKIPMLFKAIQEDLIDQLRKPKNIARVRIGLIGYTSVGKSTVANRLLRVQNLDEEMAAAVSMEKSTFFPSEFNRAEPLIDTSQNPHRQTFVTIVDIQGLDENREVNNATREAGNYLDEIVKADCDVYLLVFDKRISEQQRKWIEFIENDLQRQCILVRSKIDEDFLKIFRKRQNQFYGRMAPENRREISAEIINQLRRDNAEGSRKVFLVADNYQPSNEDAERLQEEQPFDRTRLLDELSRVVAENQPLRVAQIALRTLAHVLNTCFRRGYILNVLKHKIAAGFAAIIPFGDQLPRYLAREGIRDTFGIDKNFHEYLLTFDLKIADYKLQTSVFEKTVKMTTEVVKNWAVVRNIGCAAGKGLVVAGASVLDDIARAISPAVTILSGTGRVIFTTATLGVGFVLTAGVCAWSAIDSGKHIFSYINRLNDDIGMIGAAFILKIISQQQTPAVVEEREAIGETRSLPIQ